MTTKTSCLFVAFATLLMAMWTSVVTAQLPRDRMKPHSDETLDGLNIEEIKRRFMGHGRDGGGGSDSRRQPSEGPAVVMVAVNTTWEVWRVDERFVSVGTSLGTLTLPVGKIFNSTRYWTLARGLSPALYRIGGAESDFSVFNRSAPPPDPPKRRDQLDNDYGHATLDINDRDGYGRLSFNNDTLYAQTWDALNEFARSVGWEIQFCLNSLLRNGSEWDATNAIDMIDYTAEKGYRVMWNLGNEPNGFRRKANMTISPAQMSKDYQRMRRILNRHPSMAWSFVPGPDVSSPVKNLSQLETSNDFLKEFLQSVGNAVTNVTTFHFYFMSGRTVGFFNLTDPGVPALLAANIARVREYVQLYRPQRPRIWITESGVTFGGTTSGESSSYLIGLLTYAKLGLAARHGVDLLVQQHVVGQKYGGSLMDGNFNPHLTYWLLLFHKRLMGTRVLDASITVSSGNNGSFSVTEYVKVYAHCTKTSSLYARGAVTLMIINMLPIDAARIQLSGPLSNATIHEYLFLPFGPLGLLSPHATMNGVQLKMTDDLTLPSYPPRLKSPGSIVSLPPTTYGFYVLPHANASACL